MRAAELSDSYAIRWPSSYGGQSSVGEPLLVYLCPHYQPAGHITRRT